MRKPRPLVDRRLALRLLTWQLTLAVALVLLAALRAPASALAVGLGAAIAVLANAWFVWRAFGRDNPRPEQIVQDFYRGEAGKLVLTVLLFAGVFTAYPAVSLPWLMTGFILELFVAWCLPLVAALRGER